MLTDKTKQLFIAIASKTLETEFDFSEKQIQEFQGSFDFHFENLLMEYIQSHTSKDDRNVCK